MSRVYKFHSSEVLPIVTARVFGKHRSKLVRLVFDTGAATTQIHTPIIDVLGMGQQMDLLEWLHTVRQVQSKRDMF